MFFAQYKMLMRRRKSQYKSENFVFVLLNQASESRKKILLNSTQENYTKMTNCTNKKQCLLSHLITQLSISNTIHTYISIFQPKYYKAGFIFYAQKSANFYAQPNFFQKLYTYNV